MADIVGRGQIRLLLPYVRGTGGPPPSGTTLPPQGPILEKRKREDCHVCKWGRVLGSQQPGSDINTWVVKGQVCEQRIHGVPDRWRSAAW